MRRNAVDRLYSMVLKRFSEEQPGRKLTVSEMDGIWYGIYGKLCRGEAVSEVEEWCKTAPLAEEEAVHRPMRCGY